MTVRRAAASCQSEGGAHLECAVEQGQQAANRRLVANNPAIHAAVTIRCESGGVR
jgi:hypothetical protein